MSLHNLKIGIVPGTGNMGYGIAKNIAGSGLTVLLGSRELAKATQAVEKIKKELGKSDLKISPHSNEEVAAEADVIFWTIQAPLEERHQLLAKLSQHLKGKIIVDVTNVMYYYDESKWGQISSVDENIAALGVPARWIHGYKSTFAGNLLSPIDAHGRKRVVVIGGDDEEAVNILKGIIQATGYDVLQTGPNKNARIVELLGPRWIGTVNKLNAPPAGDSFGYWTFNYFVLLLFLFFVFCFFIQRYRLLEEHLPERGEMGHKEYGSEGCH